MSVDQIARWALRGLVAASWNSSAFAANGLPSRATLNEMGIGSLQIMTDTEGLSVRGQGAIAYGKSWAVVSGTGRIGRFDQRLSFRRLAQRRRRQPFVRSRLGQERPAATAATAETARAANDKGRQGRQQGWRQQADQHQRRRDQRRQLVSARSRLEV